MSIIVHKQEIAEKEYIRIITVESVLRYLDELKKAYHIDLKTDANMQIFYNCGDFYPRLIHDLGYKKFNVKIENVCKGLWRVEVDNPNWFEDVYIGWIRNKLKSYIDDCDEPYYFVNVEDVLWKEFAESKKVLVEFQDDKTVYKLNNCEFIDDNFVLTRDHILSIIFHYVNTNYTIIMSYNTEIDICINKCVDDLVVIDKTRLLRGYTINKNTLQTNDVMHILFELGVNKNMLKSIATCKRFKQVSEASILTNVQDMETNPFNTCYGFLEKIDNDSCLNEIEGAFTNLHFTKKSAVKVEHFGIFEVYDGIKEPKKTTLEQFLFKNSLNDELLLFEKALVYLSEFICMSPLGFKDPMIFEIIKSFANGSCIGNEFLSELKQLVDILDAGKGPVEVEKEGKADQKRLTKVYVDMFKNDSLETLASTVVDNVCKFLVENSLVKEEINKNQIGKDLVEFGVCKTRKARGYVYGIEDTSYMDDPLMFKVDHSKVSKENHQLRENIDISLKDFPMMYQPGKFMMLRS